MQKKKNEIKANYYKMKFQSKGNQNGVPLEIYEVNWGKKKFRMFSTFPLMVSTMSIYRSDLNGDVEELSSLKSESKTSLLLNRKAKLPRRWVRQLNFLLAESENFLVMKSES